MSIIKRFLDQRGYWPCILKLILEQMKNIDANNFGQTCKSAREAVERFRPEIKQIKNFIRNIHMNGCGFQALPNRMGCAGGSQSSCRRIANEVLLFGSQWEAKEILTANKNFLQYGMARTRCYFSWYCFNIDDQVAFSFINRNSINPRVLIDDPTTFSFLTTNGINLRARAFFRLYFCLIHQWIIDREWIKFSRALAFFNKNEQKCMLDPSEDKCWCCGHLPSIDIALVQKMRGDQRFYDYIFSLFNPEARGP